MIPKGKLKSQEAIIDPVTPAAEDAQRSDDRIWSNRNFRIFWFGRSIDALCDSFIMIATPLLVLESTGSVTQMGLVYATESIGSLAASTLCGPLIDHFDRRKMMSICDAVRAFFYLSLPVGWHLMGPRLWLIYITALVTGCFTVSFVISSGAALTNIVDQRQITKANGLVQSSVAASFVVGPALAGFATKQLGAALAIGLTGLLYSTTASLMLSLRMSKAATTRMESKSERGLARLAGVFLGVRFLLRNPVLKPIILILVTAIFLSEAVINLSIFHLRRDLNQTENSIGIIFGVASLGGILAGTIVYALRQRWGFGLCFLGGLILQGIAIIFIGSAPNVTVIAVMAVAFMFSYSLIRIIVMSLRQQVTPDHIMGRVSSAYWMLLAVLGPLGVTASTALANRIGVSLVLVLLGVIIIFVAALGLFTQARGRTPEAQCDTHGGMN